MPTSQWLLTHEGWLATVFSLFKHTPSDIAYPLLCDQLSFVVMSFDLIFNRFNCFFKLSYMLLFFMVSVI
jgi:hypothetical protein